MSNKNQPLIYEECQICSHSEICKLKSEYENIVKSIENIDIAFERDKSGAAISFQNICHVDFIKSIDIHCKHFADKTGVYRAFDPCYQKKERDYE